MPCYSLHPCSTVSFYQESTSAGIQDHKGLGIRTSFVSSR